MRLLNFIKNFENLVPKTIFTAKLFLHTKIRIMFYERNFFIYNFVPCMINYLLFIFVYFLCHEMK